MKFYSQLHKIGLVLLFVLTVGCQAAKTGFQFSPEVISTVANQEVGNENMLHSEPSIHQIEPAEKSLKTVGNPVKKVMPVLSQLLPKTNTSSIPESRPLKLKPVLVKKVRNIKDEPVRGPVYVLSGIFLALGMAALLTSLVLLIIGTGGAGILAIIGGSSFLVGSILAFVCLLSV